MWLHTNLRPSQVYASAPADVGVNIEDSAGSRTHERKFRVYLEPLLDTTPEGKKRRKTNSGNHGAGYGYAATYDEWGHFLAKVFEQDPSAKTDGNAYDGAEDFHNKTEGKYLTGDPVLVHVHGTGGGGYSRYVRVELPTDEDMAPGEWRLHDWWGDVVFPHTGSGFGGYSVDSAEVKDAPATHAHLIGETTEWEG